MIKHVATGDVLLMHADPVNENCLFQVASQFNCLEFGGPDVTPEDGITDYAHDSTQGPACSLAAAPATLYRNYFAQVGSDQVGQTHDCQINNLEGLERMMIDQTGKKYWTVRNGYTNSSEAELRDLKELLTSENRDQFVDAICIGLHSDVEVSFATRYSEPDVPQKVSQAFCSAVSCGYTSISNELWASLATLVLDAMYEATLWAAVLNARRTGQNRVWLTFIGGGVFGNDYRWIASAIGRACYRVRKYNLEVCVSHFRTKDSEIEQMIDDAFKNEEEKDLAITAQVAERAGD